MTVLIGYFFSLGGVSVKVRQTLISDTIRLKQGLVSQRYSPTLLDSLRTGKVSGSSPTEYLDLASDSRSTLALHACLFRLLFVAFVQQSPATAYLAQEKYYFR